MRTTYYILILFILLGLFACYKHNKLFYETDKIFPVARFHYDKDNRGYIYTYYYYELKDDNSGILYFLRGDKDLTSPNKNLDILGYINYTKAEDKYPVLFPVNKKHKYYSYVANGECYFSELFTFLRLNLEFFDIYIAKDADNLSFQNIDMMVYNSNILPRDFRTLSPFGYNADLNAPVSYTHEMRGYFSNGVQTGQWIYKDYDITYTSMQDIHGYNRGDSILDRSYINRDWIFNFDKNGFRKDTCFYYEWKKDAINNELILSPKAQFPYQEGKLYGTAVYINSVGDTLETIELQNN